MKNMKKITILLLLTFTFSVAQTWTQKNNFIESYLDNGIAINNEGYALISYDVAGEFKSRIYKYDETNDSWSIIATLPGVPRQGAGLFSINSKIYVAGGLPMSDPLLGYPRNTMFEYDLNSHLWTQKSNIGSIPEFFLTTYSLYCHAYNGKGYIFVSGANQIVEYNPVTDTYIQKADCPSGIIPGGKKFSFIYDDKIYVGLSTYNSGYDELWEYNTTTNTWTQRANSLHASNDCLSFVINDDFYIGLGVFSGDSNSLIYKYSITNNTWTLLSDSAPLIKTGGFAFAINNKAYACGGLTTSEVWAFDPAVLSNIENSSEEKIILYPNPIKNNESLHIKSENSCSSYKIYNLNGSIVTKGNLENNSIKLPNLSNGSYIITLVFENGIKNTQTLLIE